MEQQTSSGFERYGKTTRRAQFLTDMDRMARYAPRFRRDFTDRQ